MKVARPFKKTITQVDKEAEAGASNDGKWETPKKRNTIKPTKDSQRDIHLVTSNENVYEHLNDDDKGQMETENDDSATSTKTAAIRPPPIIITGIGVKDTITMLTQNGVTKTEFRLKQVYVNSNITLSTINITTYQKIIKILEDKKLQYYTYTPKNLKPKTIVLEGVKGEFTPEEI